MFKDIILYWLIALPSLAVIAVLPLLVGREPNGEFLLAAIVYVVAGTWIVFRWCNVKSNHAPGQATLIAVMRNIWWALWWPWFVWKKWND